MKFAVVFAAASAPVFLLSGCGADANQNTSSTSAPTATTTAPGMSSTTAPAANSSTTVPVNSSTTVPAINSSTTVGPDSRTPVYVVLRLDDVATGSSTEGQIACIDWAINNKVKFNVGIVASVWPDNCLSDPESDPLCGDPVMQRMNKAYTDGYVKGNNSQETIIEILSHSCAHTAWGEHFYKSDFNEFQANDLQCSAAKVRKAFPGATIRGFIPPETLSDAVTVQEMLNNGLDIISAQAQLVCNDPYYSTGPCENDHGEEGDGPWACIPADDVYFTTDRGPQMANGMFSTPGGSANSRFDIVDTGHTVKDTLGAGPDADCGCANPPDKLCAIIPNAIENSRKSNGVHWSVVMMHPFTTFKTENGEDQSYAEWLDEFLVESRNLQDYDIQFINFQDLTEVRAVAAELITV